MVVAEFIQTDGSKAANPKLRNDIVMACFDLGLLVLGCGRKRYPLQSGAYDQRSAD